MVGINADGTLACGTGATSTFFRDADGDGFGNPALAVQAGSAPAGYVAGGTDCDDSAAAVHPGAPEVPNGTDDNCNGQVDEGTAPVMQFFLDADRDGFGDPGSSVFAPTAPPGYVSDNRDCNDGSAAVRPGAPEVANGLDDNCNGQIDEGIAFLRSLVLVPDTVVVGEVVEGRVALAAPAQADTDVLLSSSSGIAAVPSSVTVAAGSSEATFEVLAVTAGATTITATLGGDSRTAHLRVLEGSPS